MIVSSVSAVHPRKLSQMHLMEVSDICSYIAGKSLYHTVQELTGLEKQLLLGTFVSLCHLLLNKEVKTKRKNILESYICAEGKLLPDSRHFFQSL